MSTGNFKIALSKQRASTGPKLCSLGLPCFVLFVSLCPFLAPISTKSPQIGRYCSAIKKDIYNTMAIVVVKFSGTVLANGKL